MNKKELDFTHFSPEVFQAVAGENYTVYAYMNDGNVRVLDVKPLIEKGGIKSNCCLGYHRKTR